ncbi:hypothetical protein FRX31_001963 [Thalictrum thalictroides]|uniref:Uncharacterized protein n=1 Tax=Thalictrum thalictroides TaxID=46969 RepID=A0A7J6XI40_THATH|nr:hypothetical protein FRX31_001963 [Thalictrum thalictroides]
MWKLLFAFLSIEATAEASALSMYSISGLLSESQVDIVSSKETEHAPDWLREISMLQDPRRGVTVGASLVHIGRLLSFLETGVPDFIAEDAGTEFCRNDVLLVQAESPLVHLCHQRNTSTDLNFDD